MPTKHTVKIKTIQGQQRGDKDGYMIKGYDATNQEAFNKFIFETTQKGELTKVAEVIQVATPGSWYEFTCDDSKWKNATYVTPCAAPEGGAPPDENQAQSNRDTSSGGGGGGGKNRMTKEEWAAKDAAKELSMARHKALQTAAVSCAADGGKVTKAKMEQIEKMSHRFTSFLLTGDFEGKPAAPAPKEEAPVDTNTPESVDNTPTGGADDDIPF